MSVRPSTWAAGVQRRVLDAVYRHPGSRRGDIEDATGLSPMAVKQALRALRDTGRVRVRQPLHDARLRHYYPSDVSPKTPTQYQGKEPG